MILGIDPIVDFAFKRVFGDERNTDILIHLLNAILKLVVPIVSVEILNPFNDKDFSEDKLTVLDVKARDQLAGCCTSRCRSCCPSISAPEFRFRYDRWNDFYYRDKRVYSRNVTININEGHYKNTYSRPEQRREGEALYAKVHPERASSMSTGNSNSRRQASEVVSNRKSTGSDNGTSRRSTGTVEGNTRANTNSSAGQSTVTNRRSSSETVSSRPASSTKSDQKAEPARTTRQQSKTESSSARRTTEKAKKETVIRQSSSTKKETESSSTRRK